MRVRAEVCGRDGLREFHESRLNLAVCPSELIALDPNAEMLWPKLLRTVGVTVSKGEHIEERRAWILRNFGLPALLQRLKPGMLERQRAQIWWREAAACSEGESIPYRIMKEIMAKYSSEEHQGVASFEHAPASENQPLLFEFTRPLDDLESMLLVEYAGQTLTVEEVYNLHNVGKPYTMKNYKAVLLRMEQEKIIQTDPPSAKRRKGTIGDNVKITFPPDKK